MSMYFLCKTRSCFSLGQQLQTLYSRNISSTTIKCSMISRFKRMGSAQRNYFMRDNMPSHMELIYRAPMEWYLHWSNNLSTLSAAVISGMALYRWATDHFINLKTINLGKIVSKEQDIWYFAGAFILLNIVTRWFVTRYALRIYKDSDKYVAVYASQIPFRSSYNQFPRGKVAAAGMRLNPWSECMYRLGNRSTLLLLDYFKTPAEFHMMCRPLKSA